MESQLDDKTILLQDQVKKLQSQKDSLIKELNTVEEALDQTRRMYGKYLPFIFDMAGTGDTAFANTCRHLAKAFRKGATPEKIAYLFEQLKTAMIQEDIAPISVKRKKGMFSSFFSGSSDNTIEDLRQEYHDILNRLRSTLEQKYTPRLDGVLEMLVAATDSRDIMDARQSIFNLIFDYISDASTDREEVTQFIRQIIVKILEIESRLSGSFEQAESLYQSNAGFETELNREMHGLKASSKSSVTLEDLKRQVTQRLTAIENTLTKKQLTDKAIREASLKNRQVFNTSFERLRRELDKATQYSGELEKKLNTDQLTGAHNRRAYDRKMAEEMDRFLRYGTPFSLLVIDVDHFKRINDRFGHAIGDRCLKELIRRTLPLLRKIDMLARFGGEEFVVIMPHTETAGAQICAEKIRQTIEKTEFLYKDEMVRITVSIGVSQVRPEDTTFQDLFNRADIAVYQAKDNGRNQVRIM